MRLLLDSDKFENFSKIGLVVTFNSLELDKPSVVVGICNCIEREGVVTSELGAYGLPSPDWEASMESVLRHYPAGLCATGIWIRVEGCGTEVVEPQVNALIKNTNVKDAFSSRSTLLLSVSSDKGRCIVEAYQFDASCSSLQLIPVECIQPPGVTVGGYLSQNTTMFRVRASLPIFITDRNIERPLSTLSQSIQSPSFLFLIDSVRILFGETSGVTVRKAFPEKFKLSAKQSLDINYMAHAHKKPILIELLENATSEITTHHPPAPTLKIGDPLKEGCVHLTIPIDVLGLAEWDLTLGEVAMHLKETICAQLRAIKDEIQQTDTLHSVSIHHFPLDNQDCPVTVVYLDMPLEMEGGSAKSLTNEELQPRRALHRIFFCLGSKSSQLRVLSGKRTRKDLDWNSVQHRGPQLLNPHLTVKHTRVKNGMLALVEGSYLYYHYMQDGFNDNGWGCAYRSLQTLWSWFYLKGYTDKDAPNHRHIQETLVKVGDKVATFTGSKEWIGSFEVSTVLNQLLGIECKIHHCRDMISAGRVLLSHFRSQGTPVMIGGGVLAHTILGVDFNTSTGEIQFLILDPHYTGKDDLKTIMDKGWCGWKTLTFWDSSVHYNMCLPQVPDEEEENISTKS